MDCIALLKRGSDLNDQQFFPQTISFEHYRNIFSDMQFASAILNSIGIASIAALFSVLLGMLAAYAIVRLEFPGRRLMLIGILMTAMFPPVAIIGPLFDIWRITGLYDTWLGLILPYMTFTLPLAIWILAAFSARFHGIWRKRRVSMVPPPCNPLSASWCHWLPPVYSLLPSWCLFLHGTISYSPFR